jgi:hypothetical protein
MNELLDNYSRKPKYILINDNSHNKHGKHKYSGDEFGMKDSQIIERFEAYMNQIEYKT